LKPYGGFESSPLRQIPSACQCRVGHEHKHTECARSVYSRSIDAPVLTEKTWGIASDAARLSNIFLDFHFLSDQDSANCFGESVPGLAGIVSRRPQRECQRLVAM